MDAVCPIQIVMDQFCRTPADISQLQRDLPSEAVHTIKVPPPSFLSLSPSLRSPFTHSSSSSPGSSGEVLDNLWRYLSLSSHQRCQMESSSWL
jgi:hypothetical protein